VLHTFANERSDEWTGKKHYAHGQSITDR